MYMYVCMYVQVYGVLRKKVEDNLEHLELISEHLISPCSSPGVDLRPGVEEYLDDVDVASRCRQAEWSVVRDVAVLLIGSPQQQQLHHLTRARHAVGRQGKTNMEKT